jgi:hypothetical protein
MKIHRLKTLFLIAILPINLMVVSAQGKISPYFQISYLKNTENKSYLKASLTYSKDRMEVPIAGMKIDFFAGTDRKTGLETGTTNEKGVAMILLPDKSGIPANRDGSWSFTSEFAGNDTIEASSSNITITDVNLGMVLSLIDSVKTISVKATKIAGGSESPAGGETVIVYVPRMFSMLSLGEITLDDSGSGSLVFPQDLPGDREGNITVIAKFEDNPSFGNIENAQTLKWGVPSDYSVPTTHRALWTKGAPKWMIYTLSVLLAGVWGHYLFAIISLIRIRLEAKKEEKKQRYEL